METSQSPRQTWSSGFAMLVIAPFIGLILTFTDPPRWLQIIGIVVMLLLVGSGCAMMRRQSGGWRPSDTLPAPDDDGRR